MAWIETYRIYDHRPELAAVAPPLGVSSSTWQWHACHRIIIIIIIRVYSLVTELNRRAL